MGKWEMVRLGDVCEISPPKKELSAVDKEIEVSFVPMADLQSHQKLFQVKETKKLSEVIKSYTYFRDNDVLLAKITPCFENGKCGIAKNLTNGIGFGSTEFIVFRPNSNVLSEWVYYCVARSQFLTEGSRNMTGTAGQQRVLQDFVKSYIIPLPPLEIQKQIAQTLDAASELIVLYKKQLAELDNLIKATFYDMFGDPVTNEKGWEVVSISEVCNKITDGTHNSPKNLPVGDYMYITAKNIKRYGIDISNMTYVSSEVHRGIYSRCNPELGDILYIKDGVTTGIAQINSLDEEFSMLSSVALLKQNRDMISNYYMREVLNNENMYNSIRQNMGGAAITRLTLTKISNIEIPLPPLTLQTQFAATVTAIEAQKSLIQTALSESQTLFDSLMSQYFD